MTSWNHHRGPGLLWYHRLLTKACRAFSACPRFLSSFHKFLYATPPLKKFLHYKIVNHHKAYEMILTRRVHGGGGIGGGYACTQIWRRPSWDFVWTFLIAVFVVVAFMWIWSMSVHFCWLLFAACVQCRYSRTGLHRFHVGFCSLSVYSTVCTYAHTRWYSFSLAGWSPLAVFTQTSSGVMVFDMLGRDSV